MDPDMDLLWTPRCSPMDPLWRPYGDGDPMMDPPYGPSRTGNKVPWKEGRDLWLGDEMKVRVGSFNGFLGVP